jgi:hypothetical protein
MLGFPGLARYGGYATSFMLHSGGINRVVNGLLPVERALSGELAL